MTGLTALEWSQGSVRFMATKMDSVSAWDIWVEVIEPELSRLGVMENVEPIIEDAIAFKKGETPKFTATQVGMIVGKIMMDITPGVKKRLRFMLFPTVSFSTLATPSPQPLIPEVEKLAFATLEPSDIYQVLLRLIAINFTQSFVTLFRSTDLTTPDSSPSPLAA